MTEIREIGKDASGAIIDAVTALELTYPEELRAGRNDICDMLSAPGSVAFCAFVQNECAGAVIGYPLDDEELSLYHLEGVYPSDGTAVYLESITVDSRFRGMGVGYELLRAFVLRAKGKGYLKITGHFRQNGSLALFLKIGGRAVHTEKDWFKTGEDFVCCECDLSRLPTDF
ncbi:MAG: GNAT family N-acetyltransferase [Spirochaetota bacterium]